MTYRDLERAKSKLDAEHEKLNVNGYRRVESPISTRTKAEAEATNRAPDPEPTQTHNETVAGTGFYPGEIGRVRDRVAARENVPVAPKPETLYEQEVRLFGRTWADVYRRQRED